MKKLVTILEMVISTCHVYGWIQGNISPLVYAHDIAPHIINTQGLNLNYVNLSHTVRTAVQNLLNTRGVTHNINSSAFDNLWSYALNQYESDPEFFSTGSSSSAGGLTKQDLIDALDRYLWNDDSQEPRAFFNSDIPMVGFYNEPPTIGDY